MSSSCWRPGAGFGCMLRDPDAIGERQGCKSQVKLLPFTAFPVSPDVGCHAAQAEIPNSRNSLTLALLQKPSCLEVTHNSAHGPKSQSWFHASAYRCSIIFQVVGPCS